MNIHFIQHESFEAPGAYLNWAQNLNYNTTFSKVYNQQSLPINTDKIDLLIVLGGPQSPKTTKIECPYFDAQAEIALIKEAINNGKAVVGVCLGSQLIGEALGANYESSPEKEIGVFPINLTDAGITDDKIKHFGTSLLVGHWHNDMPGITNDAEILATSLGCTRQIIKYSDIVYGFQCHMEFTPDVVQMLIDTDFDFLSKNTTHQFVQKPSEIKNFDFNEMNEKLYIFLDKLIDSYNKTK